MTAAKRITPTRANNAVPGGNGEDVTDAIDVEVEAIWQVLPERLINVGGTGDAITAETDSTLVDDIISIGRGKSFTFIAAANNGGGTTVTIAIDGVITENIKDVNGDDLAENAIVADAEVEIRFDGIDFRVIGGSSSGGGGTTSGEYDVQGGRITLSTGVPVLGANVSAATSIFWTPDTSGRIGLYDGVSQWDVLTQTEKSVKLTDAQTGTTHNGTKVIDGLADTSQLVVGDKISGTNVGGGATIQSIDSPTQVTGTVNSTGSATNTITFKAPADTGYDVFGKNVSSALKLFRVKRASILTQNATQLQDGVEVLSGDPTMRLLGAVITSGTDGQADWTNSGQRRFRVWNRYNKRTRSNSEQFTNSATYFKPMGLMSVLARVGSGGGGASDTNAAATSGGTSSFGSLISVSGGSGASTNSSPGNGATTSSGTLNINGNPATTKANGESRLLRNVGPVFAGYGGGTTGSLSQNVAGGGTGAYAEKAFSATSIGASETVTVGAGGAKNNGGGTNPEDGGPGAVSIDEIVEF